MIRYIVEGGEFTDTSFETITPGKTIERYGPFECRDDAVKEWQKRSWHKVDNCHVRYTIIPVDETDGRR